MSVYEKIKQNHLAALCYCTAIFLTFLASIHGFMVCVLRCILRRPCIIITNCRREQNMTRHGFSQNPSLSRMKVTRNFSKSFPVS